MEWANRRSESDTTLIGATATTTLRKISPKTPSNYRMRPSIPRQSLQSPLKNLILQPVWTSPRSPSAQNVLLRR